MRGVGGREILPARRAIDATNHNISHKIGIGPYEFSSVGVGPRRGVLRGVHVEASSEASSDAKTGDGEWDYTDAAEAVFQCAPRPSLKTERLVEASFDNASGAIHHRFGEYARALKQRHPRIPEEAMSRALWQGWQHMQCTSSPCWFGEPLEGQMTVADMGFTVPVLLRALRQAMFAQDGFEVPGCFLHEGDEATKNVLRQRLEDGDNPYDVCVPTVPFEVLASMLKDWLHDLPGGLWGRDLAPEHVQSRVLDSSIGIAKQVLSEIRDSKAFQTVAELEPYQRMDKFRQKVKIAPNKGNAEIIFLMEETLGQKIEASFFGEKPKKTSDCQNNRATRVTPLLDAIEPRRREVRAKHRFLRKIHSPTLLDHIGQVLLWLLAMLDLAVEYREDSKMGYAEFAAVSAYLRCS